MLHCSQNCLAVPARVPAWSKECAPILKPTQHYTRLTLENLKLHCTDRKGQKQGLWNLSRSGVPDRTGWFWHRAKFDFLRRLSSLCTCIVRITDRAMLNCVLSELVQFWSTQLWVSSNDSHSQTVRWSSDQSVAHLDECAKWVTKLHIALELSGSLDHQAYPPLLLLLQSYFQLWPDAAPLVSSSSCESDYLWWSGYVCINIRMNGTTLIRYSDSFSCTGLTDDTKRVLTLPTQGVFQQWNPLHWSLLRPPS